MFLRLITKMSYARQNCWKSAFISRATEKKESTEYSELFDELKYEDSDDEEVEYIERNE